MFRFPRLFIVVSALAFASSACTVKSPRGGSPSSERRESSTPSAGDPAYALPPTAPPLTDAREMRGVWLASVLNIDYPRYPTPSAATLQDEFRYQLSQLKSLGFNALFVQVRPAADALYPSQYAPWSKWLTGRQGKAPTSGFDPLAFMIREAHAQGVELHAWINPYRVAMDLDVTGFAPGHVYRQHPEWTHVYAGRRYLDPGLPAVRDHLGRVLDELIVGYDLDGIHFDDYFYPYPKAGETFPDSLTFATYGRARGLADWRRDNVNAFVAETHRRIEAQKPWIHFGISPFGVWRNRGQDPRRGSDTRASVSSYDDLFGDALAWADQGTVDYLLPQLYWSLDFPAAGHRTLAHWWARNTPANVNLYVGHAAYKVGNNADTVWYDTEELPRQIALNRTTPALEGSIYFSARSLLGNRAGLPQRIGREYQDVVLLPERKAEDPVEPVKVKIYRPRRTEEGKNRLRWSIDEDLAEEQRPHYYAVYRVLPDGSRRLIHRTPYGVAGNTFSYVDTEAIGKRRKKDYAVVGLDRYHRLLYSVQAE